MSLINKAGYIILAGWTLIILQATILKAGGISSDIDAGIMWMIFWFGSFLSLFGEELENWCLDRD